MPGALDVVFLDEGVRTARSGRLTRLAPVHANDRAAGAGHNGYVHPNFGLLTGTVPTLDLVGQVGFAIGKREAEIGTFDAAIEAASLQLRSRFELKIPKTSQKSKVLTDSNTQTAFINK